MSEDQLVVDAIHDRLSQLPVALVSPMLRDRDVVELLGGQIELRVEIRHDEGSHPAIAHAHVLVTLNRPRDAEPLALDACVVAVHPDRARGLAGVGHNFCDLVAGPVLSLVLGRPVLGAVAFDGASPGGIAGHHGFLGPLLVRGLADGQPDPFEDVPAFDHAEALAPPGLVHIAKVVLDVRDDQRIRRTLEVDGHAASHVDPTWGGDRTAPANIVGLRFAVFEPHDPHLPRRHRALDQAIAAFVEHFRATRDRDAAADRLASSGVDPALVHEIRLFVPAAHARLVYGDELPLSRTFTRVRADGWTDEDLPFLGERTFARALVLATQRLDRDGEALSRAIGQASSEVAAIDHARQQGADLGSLRPLAPLVPDPDVPVEVLERVAQRLYGA